MFERVAMAASGCLVPMLLSWPQPGVALAQSRTNPLAATIIDTAGQATRVTGIEALYGGYYPDGVHQLPQVWEPALNIQIEATRLGQKGSFVESLRIPMTDIEEITFMPAWEFSNWHGSFEARLEIIKRDKGVLRLVMLHDRTAPENTLEEVDQQGRSKRKFQISAFRLARLTEDTVALELGLWAFRGAATTPSGARGSFEIVSKDVAKIRFE